MTTSASENIDKISPILKKATDKKYCVGTLTYTQASVILLFTWLLLGDFCFMLMETVLLRVLPLKLKGIAASNTLIGILVSTVPSTMTFFLNPIISFRSDRFRSKWGRRMPFLAISTPFIFLFLILIGLSDQISGGMYRHASSFMSKISPLYFNLGIVAILIICFQIFHTVVASVYYYLFNDVVPQVFLGRFLSLFRIVGVASASLFNFFIFKYVQTHMKEIWIGVALLYLVAFTIMCFGIKEGKYPPPPENIGGHRGFVSSIKTYMRECFSHPFYWYFFLGNAFWQVASCASAFIVFMQLSIGLNLDQIGKIVGISGIVSVILLYPAGILVDKIHPILVTMLAKTLIVLITPLNLIFLFYNFTPETAFWITALIMALLLPLAALYNAAHLPLYMKLLPKERYGQFSSADAMVRSFFGIIGSVALGFLIDVLRNAHSNGDYCYRYIPLWIFGFECVSLVFLFILYRKWKRHGGNKNYIAPFIQ